MDPALRNSCLRAPLGTAVWLAKYKELWLFKPILWKVKVPLCWRKPGIWANIVATLLSLLLKPLSLLSSSQINYCNHLFILVSSFALSSHQQSAQVLFCPQRVPLWTISWSLIELYFTSISFMLFCLSPDPSVTVLLHIVGMLNAFFSTSVLILFHDLFCVALYSRSAETKRLGQSISPSLSSWEIIYSRKPVLLISPIFVQLFNIKHLPNSMNCN